MGGGLFRKKKSRMSSCLPAVWRYGKVLPHLNVSGLCEDCSPSSILLVPHRGPWEAALTPVGVSLVTEMVTLERRACATFQ